MFGICKYTVTRLAWADWGACEAPSWRCVLLDVLSDGPPHDRSRKSVGCEMASSEQPRQADAGCHAVGHYRHRARWEFARKERSERPGFHRMPRRKTLTASTKPAPASILG